MEKLKGTGLKNIQLFIDRQFGANAFHQAARGHDPAWPGSVLVSSWYDADLPLAVLRRYASRYPGGFGALCFDAAGYTLEQDLNGIYRMFMRLGGAVRVLGATPLMVKSYSTFMTLAIVENVNGSYVADLTLPARFFEWQIAVHEGATHGILKVCGRSMDSFCVIDQAMNGSVVTARYQARY